jgi:hypothetical protein
VLLWNADHQWMSFIKQLGRARIDGFNPTYLAELIPTQFILQTPLVFILGTMGLFAMLRRDNGASASRVLINAVVWTITLYFVWHATHHRVEANWLSPIYPAVAVAAAVAATIVRWRPRSQRFVDVCARFAAPVGVAMFVLMLVQANTGLLTGYRRDASVRSVGVGFREIAGEIEAARVRIGAGCVLADDYGTTGWLAFYLPKGTCVAQRVQRYRWINMPEPSATQLAGPLLLVGEQGAATLPQLAQNFTRVEKIGDVLRKRGPLLVEAIELVALNGATGEVFDRSPPPN